MRSTDQRKQSAATSPGAGGGVLGDLRRKTQAAKQKYAGSSAEHLWDRLQSIDFINQGMIFAATLLLCMFPFLIVLNALAGRSAVTGLSRRLSLNSRAAADVSHLFTSSVATSRAVTGAAWVFFVVGGIAASTALKQLYERIFELDHRGMKDLPRQLIWLAALVGCAGLGDLAGPGLHHAIGPVVLGLVGVIALGGFWWFTMWILLAGRVSWRKLLPSAVATAVFWAGMQAVFAFTFSGIVISDHDKYGAIGDVFALMSWLIAIGVVIILGAAVGIVWQDRNMSFQAGPAKLRRTGKEGGQ